jgi:transposase
MIVRELKLRPNKKLESTLANWLWILTGVYNFGTNQLRNFISYKSDNHGRKCVFVDSVNTTKTCSSCWSLTGPIGLNKLSVRSWECSTCGVVHDRDINSAMVVLKIGSGTDLKEVSNVFN